MRWCEGERAMRGRVRHAAASAAAAQDGDARGRAVARDSGGTSAMEARRGRKEELVHNSIKLTGRRREFTLRTVSIRWNFELK